MGAIPYHVGIRVWDDVGRDILGLHLLAKGCELHCGIDHSNWKVLSRERKTPTHTHRHILFRENDAWVPSIFLGRALGVVGWVGWAGLERNGAATDVMG